jgi:hypothetical protein
MCLAKYWVLPELYGVTTPKSVTFRYWNESTGICQYFPVNRHRHDRNFSENLPQLQKTMQSTALYINHKGFANEQVVINDNYKNKLR